MIFFNISPQSITRPQAETTHSPLDRLPNPNAESRIVQIESSLDRQALEFAQIRDYLFYSEINLLKLVS